MCVRGKPAQGKLAFDLLKTCLNRRSEHKLLSPYPPIFSVKVQFFVVETKKIQPSRRPEDQCLSFLLSLTHIQLKRVKQEVGEHKLENLVLPEKLGCRLQVLHKQPTEGKFCFTFHVLGLCQNLIDKYDVCRQTCRTPQKPPSALTHLHPLRLLKKLLNK